VLLVALLFVLAGAALAAGELERVDRDVDRLVDDISPARVRAQSLSTAYLDQETGVRGFILSRDPAALEPYVQGQRQAAEDTAEIRRLIGEGGQIANDLAAIEAAGDRWRTEYAEKAIATVRAAPVGEDVRLNEKRGTTRFDMIRDRFEQLNTSLVAERAAARESVVDEMFRIRALTAIGFAAAVLAGFALWLSLRRLVLVPLDRLGAETREVARGDFGRPVAVNGPLEIRRLGADVDEMRQQLALALADARHAEEEVRAQAELLVQQTDDLRRSNEELEQFAYVASHDLQEPLRKVASFCQMLQRRYHGQLDERADQYIDFAVDGAKRMQQLINDLLAFSRVGRTTAGFEDVDTAEIAQHALGALGDVPEEAGAQVEFGSLPTVQGDDALLTQVFQNLIGNAIKFRSPDRPPVIRVSAEREGEFWHFRCEDNGIGIDPQYADRIFVIFQRLHSKDLYGGTGIGLSLCKKIVEYHGGRIWLDTDRNGAPGSVVHWTLPVEPAHANAAAGAAVEGKV
jgi:signal transduction histidine kinase